MQRPAPEDGVMAARVENLRGQEGLDLMVGVVHLVKPLADEVGLNGRLLGQLGAKLAHGQFNLVGLGCDLLPCHFQVAHPPPLDSLFVQVHCVIGPQVNLGAQGVKVSPGYSGNGKGPPGPATHVGTGLRDFPVASQVQVSHGEAALSRLGANAPLQCVIHPGKAGVLRRCLCIRSGRLPVILQVGLLLLLVVWGHYQPLDLPVPISGHTKQDLPRNAVGGLIAA